MTRTAAEIGAGLAAARPARPIQPGERIHVVGVAGAGASGAAILASAAGAIVTGCDPGGPSPYTPALEARGVALAWSHDPGHVTTQPRPDRLAVSKAITAVEPDHPELAAARSLGIRMEPWQQLVADAGFGRRLTAVAGTHGKSTTAGWLTHVLAQAGRDPSALVGALLSSSITGGFPATARVGGGAELVVEADEYAGNFDAYRPDIAVITNVDWDHPDVFVDRAAVVEAFAAWLGAEPDATLVANVGDAGVRELLARLGPRSGEIVTVGLEATTASRHESLVAEVLSSPPSGTEILFVGDGGGPIEPVRLRLAGSHNVSNAVAVAGAALSLGLSWDEIRVGLESFEGVGRRLERKGEAAGVAVYDDYGHHPTAIRATLQAIRQLEPGRRVWIAHEPLTFHRTAALLDDLARSLAEADGVAVADIWPGRDPDRTIASAAAVASAVSRLEPGKPVAAPGDVDATAAWLTGEVRAGDVVLVMGGGRSYRIGEELLEQLRDRESPESAS